MTVYGAGRRNVSADVGAQNTFTEAMQVMPGERVSVSVSGTFSGTVNLQRSYDDGSNWNDVPQPDGTVGWTGVTEQTYDTDEACLIRLGIKTGDYTSGTATCRLGKG